MNTTEKYFNLTVNELLATNEDSYTKEERLLFDEGLNCTFFDDEKEYLADKERLEEWLHDRGMEIKTTLITINERIAVISI